LLFVRGQVDVEPASTSGAPDGSVLATPLPSTTPMPTPEDPVQRHLSLIIGVPTGVGLALLALSSCGVWLVCSTYCERRKASGDQSAGTHSTNAVSL
jgi:hypothetical protein